MSATIHRAGGRPAAQNTDDCCARWDTSASARRTGSGSPSGLEKRTAAGHRRGAALATCWSGDANTARGAGVDREMDHRRLRRLTLQHWAAQRRANIVDGGPGHVRVLGYTASPCVRQVINCRVTDRPTAPVASVPGSKNSGLTPPTSPHTIGTLQCRLRDHCF